MPPFSWKATPAIPGRPVPPSGVKAPPVYRPVPAVQQKTAPPAYRPFDARPVQRGGMGPPPVYRPFGSPSAQPKPNAYRAAPKFAVQRRANVARVIQRRRLFRLLTDTNTDAFVAKHPMTADEIQRWGRQNIGGQATFEQSILLMGEFHAQNMLGIDNAESPFLSLTSNAEQTAKAGTLVDIVHAVKEFWEFEIDDKYIVPVGNDVSLGEGEVLVWVPKGKNLKSIATYNPEAHHNPWRGLGIQDIKAGTRKPVGYGMYL